MEKYKGRTWSCGNKLHNSSWPWMVRFCKEGTWAAKFLGPKKLQFDLGHKRDKSLS